MKKCMDLTARVSRVRVILLCGAACLGAGHAFAATYNYVIIDVPGSTSTRASAINRNEVVVGSYLKADGAQRGYTYSKGIFRIFSAPAPNEGAPITPTAIGPTGLVAGIYGRSEVLPFTLLPTASHTTPLGYPTDGEHDVIPTSISQDPFGNVAGYLTYQGTIIGFNTQEKFEEFVEESIPNASSTTQTGYAWNGPKSYERPVGNFITDRQHGWKDDSTDPIDPPGSVNTNLGYLNNNGDLGGYAADSSGTIFGFVRRGTTFARYDYPDAKSTTVIRNLDNQVFGEYVDGAGLHHVYHNVNGKYYTISPIAGASTTLTGVANDGALTGSVIDSSGVEHGYIAMCTDGRGKCTQ